MKLGWQWNIENEILKTKQIGSCRICNLKGDIMTMEQYFEDIDITKYMAQKEDIALIKEQMMSEDYLRGLLGIGANLNCVDVFSEDEQNFILKKIGKLSHIKQSVIFLKFWRRLTIKGISSHLHMSVDRVEKILNEAIYDLRKVYADEFGTWQISKANKIQQWRLGNLSFC